MGRQGAKIKVHKYKTSDTLFLGKLRKTWTQTEMTTLLTQQVGSTSQRAGRPPSLYLLPSVCGLVCPYAVAELVVVVIVVVIVVVVVVAVFLQIRGITSVKLMMDGIDVTRNRCRRVSYRTWVPFLPSSAEPVVVCLSLPCVPGALAS